MSPLFQKKTKTDYQSVRISFTTASEERARQGAELQDLYSQGKHAEILAAVQECLPLEEAGSFMAELEMKIMRKDALHS